MWRRGIVAAMAWVGVSCAAGGCTAFGPYPWDASASDAGACRSDADCDDGVFCNGAEHCLPLVSGADPRGCLASPRTACQSGAELCDEAARSCRPTCGTTDADGDGHSAIACGGDDCDDRDGARHPGAPETCDTAGHDEDCDGTTLGFDVDGDGYVFAACCNARSDGTLLCGTDCNDSSAAIHPGAPELCDGVDNDCDGHLDLGCACTDGATQACGTPDGAGGWLALGLCHPGLATCSGGAWQSCVGDVAPGSEVCNGSDDDCDGRTDEAGGSPYYADCDRDGFGAAGSAAVTWCAAPISSPPSCTGGAWAAAATDCDDGNTARHPGAPELCNAIDDDCDTSVDGAAASAACSGGASCVSGACTCAGGTTSCAGACVDLQASALHCSACGHACASGMTCRAGQCTWSGSLQSCSPPCSARCMDTGSNPWACGTCSTQCALGQACVGGTCQATTTSVGPVRGPDEQFHQFGCCSSGTACSFGCDALHRGPECPPSSGSVNQVAVWFTAYARASDAAVRIRNVRIWGRNGRGYGFTQLNGGAALNFNGYIWGQAAASSACPCPNCWFGTSTPVTGYVTYCPGPRTDITYPSSGSWTPPDPAHPVFHPSTWHYFFDPASYPEIVASAEIATHNADVQIGLDYDYYDTSPQVLACDQWPHSTLQWEGSRGAWARAENPNVASATTWFTVTTAISGDGTSPGSTPCQQCVPRAALP